ncbi:hypothetical protein [Xanthobacter sediminis]
MSVETLAPSPSEHRSGPRAPGGTEGHVQGDGHRHTRRHEARPVRIGLSVLRMSLGMRLALAAALLVPLWIAVALVVG